MVCFLQKISDNTNGTDPVAVIIADCKRSWPDGVTTRLSRHKDSSPGSVASQT